MMNVGARGIALVKGFETLALKAYQKKINGKLDKWTCGWGHTGSDVGPNTTCTPEKADAWLMTDLATAEHAVNTSIKVPLNQNQFDALVDFTYNVGADAEEHSTLVKLINTHDLADAPAEIMKWNHVNGQVSNGLTRRREAERDLFTEAV